MISISLTTNIDQVVKNLEDKFKRQVPFAAAKALTNTAYKVNAAIKDEMQRTFQGGATPYTLRAFKVTMATKRDLVAAVALRTDGPAKGTPWDKALAHLFTGGVRRWKRMEGAFRSIRALPNGYMMVPGAACPLDGYGNPPRALVVQLLSYFKAFSESGYRANMTDKRKAKLAKRGVTPGGYKTINGVEYFISYGRNGRPGGDRYTEGRHDQHLPAGIWARSGIHGSTVKPIFMFVHAGRWDQKIDLWRIAQQVVARDFDAEFSAALASAIGSAR